MSTTCGVELKGSEAILSVISKQNDGSYTTVPLSTKKITLDSSENRANVQDAQNNINDFIKENDVGDVFIKSRNKKGEFAGGADTFKMEALFQNSNAESVEMISPQAISSHQKKNDIVPPESLNKYQHSAYLAAITGVGKKT